jgi:hypothetical protein
MPTKPAHRRARNLDDQAIEQIVEILDGWDSPKLTWKLFIEQIFLRLRTRYTRQALNNYIRIKHSFAACKKVLAGRNHEDPKEKTPEQQRIARLEAENERLRWENNNLLEQFNRWVYNGYLKQMDVRMRDFMNQPLPPVYREPSEKTFGTKVRKQQE